VIAKEQAEQLFTADELAAIEKAAESITDK